MMKNLFFIALMLSTSVSHAGVIIGGTRVIYHGEKKEASIRVKNPDKYSYLVQSWVNGETSVSDKAPFIITPPLFRLGGGEENTLRIINTSMTLPADRESMYWINIKSIPAMEKQDNVNSLQIAIKTRIKLIYRPKSLSLSPAELADKLTWRRDGNDLVVTNPTPYYMNFNNVKVDGDTVQDATYVAPMNSAKFTLHNSKGHEVSWRLINDFSTVGKEYRANL